MSAEQPKINAVVTEEVISTTTYYMDGEVVLETEKYSDPTMTHIADEDVVLPTEDIERQIFFSKEILARQEEVEPRQTRFVTRGCAAFLGVLSIVGLTGTTPLSGEILGGVGLTVLGVGEYITRKRPASIRREIESKKKHINSLKDLLSRADSESLA